MVETDQLRSRSERGEPYLFVGRERELEQLESRLVEASSSPKSGFGLVLNTGLQGSGKTQLLNQFCAQMELRNDIFCVHMGPTGLSSESAILEHIRIALGRYHNLFRFNFSINLFGFAGAEVEGATPTQESLITGLQQLKQHRDRSDNNSTMLLLVDEVQNVSESSAMVLQELQQGSQLIPMLVVVAGLQHSRRVLADRGISRFSDVLVTKALKLDECKRAFRHVLQEFDIASSSEVDVEQNIDSLANDTQGFPQHLQVYLDSLATYEIPDQGSVLLQLDWETIRTKCVERRRDYYRSRLLSLSNPNYKYVAHRIALEAEDNQPVSYAQIVSLVKEVSDLHEEPVNPRTCVDDLIAKGCLSEDTFGYRIEIPSFAEFLRSHIVD